MTDITKNKKIIFNNNEIHEPTIIDERKSIINVTLEQLVDDINNSSSGYCFLRVLNEYDRIPFLAQLSESDYTEIYQRKAIKLSVWIHIMKNIKLYSNYTVYRRAYLRENIGSTIISSQFSNYVVPLWYFESFEPESKNLSLIDKLINIVPNFKPKPIINILLINNHMENFVFSQSCYKISSWSNIKYNLPDEFYGLI